MWRTRPGCASRVPALCCAIAQQTLLFPATRAVSMPTIIGAEDPVHAPRPEMPRARPAESDIDTPLVLLALPPRLALAPRGRRRRRIASTRKRGFAIASRLLDPTPFPLDSGGGQRRGLAAAAAPAYARVATSVVFPAGHARRGPGGLPRPASPSSP